METLVAQGFQLDNHSDGLFCFMVTYFVAKTLLVSNVITRVLKFARFSQGKTIDEHKSPFFIDSDH